MGIKLEIVGEKSEPEKTVKLEFRRDMSEKDVLFLIGKRASSANTDVYAIRIDGGLKKFRVRKSQIEAMGFEVVIE